ncbi:hypothetical protein ABEX13_20680, partial [Bacillus siamensis]|uniref:hypothetical protein n=1 Tax=Bacillus siamensis TaxID=659243 RepID=UPI003D1C1F3C
ATTMTSQFSFKNSVHTCTSIICKHSYTFLPAEFFPGRPGYFGNNTVALPLYMMAQAGVSLTPLPS